MPDMYEGMFGPTPLQVQQAQQAALQQRGDQLAQMDPFQRANSMIYSGAGGLMGGIAEKLGAVNPQVQMAQQMQELQKGIDFNSPESLLAAAAKIKDVNPAIAVRYVQAAQALKEKNASINLKNAQAEKALRDPTFRDYEYEKMMEILNDPDSTEDMKKAAQARLDALNAKATKGTGGDSPKQMVPSNIGLLSYDKRTGKFSKNGVDLTPDEMNGLQLATNDVGLQSRLSEAKAGGKAVGTAAGTAQSKIPEVQAAMDVAARQVEELLNHPGFKEAVGMGLPGAKYITGGKVKDFTNRLEQIKGGAFLQAFNTLRGGGQITEVEGTKATAAINRMDAATSEEEFRAAAKDFLSNLQIGLEKLQKTGRLTYQAPVAPTPAPVAAPVAATPQPATAPFNTSTPEGVRALYQSGKINKQQANAILDDMKKRGVF